VGDFDRVGGDKLDALKAFLARDPIQHLFALSVLEEYGLGRPGAPELAFYTLSEGGQIRAATFVGGQGELVVPMGDALSAGVMARHLAERGLPLRSAVGERAAVDAVARAFGHPKFKLDRPQKLLSVSADDLGPFVAPQLRLAHESDLAELVQLSAAAVKESLGVDALSTEGDHFRQRVAARVRAGRTWVMRIDEKLCFKIDMGARCRYGAELENVYMVPEMRRRGLATLALGQVCRQQLSAIPRLTVRFDEKDDSLARTCRKVGFVLVRPQRLLVAE
jgi:GNAT superfamily N-acetyltransferase